MPAHDAFVGDVAQGDYGDVQVRLACNRGALLKYPSLPSTDELVEVGELPPVLNLLFQLLRRLMLLCSLVLLLLLAVLRAIWSGSSIRVRPRP